MIKNFIIWLLSILLGLFAGFSVGMMFEKGGQKHSERRYGPYTSRYSSYYSSAHPPWQRSYSYYSDDEKEEMP